MNIFKSQYGLFFFFFFFPFFPHIYLKLFQMIKTWLINMKWPQGFLLSRVDKGENRRTQTCRVTCVTRWVGCTSRTCGSIVCADVGIRHPRPPSLQYPIFTSPKCWLVGKTSHTSTRLIHLPPHPMAKHPEKCDREAALSDQKLADWNIVIIISLSYITRFLQHKNRSITMITIIP